MFDKNNLKEDVIFFIKDLTGIKKIDENTNIASPDFGIFDIDAEHIMQSFFDKFQIDERNFSIESYFQYPNYSWKDIILIRFFFKKKRYLDKLPLTINHLVEVAQKGYWFNPVFKE